MPSHFLKSTDCIPHTPAIFLCFTHIYAILKQRKIYLLAQNHYKARHGSEVMNHGNLNRNSTYLHPPRGLHLHFFSTFLCLVITLELHRFYTTYCMDTPKIYLFLSVLCCDNKKSCIGVTMPVTCSQSQGIYHKICMCQRYHLIREVLETSNLCGQMKSQLGIHKSCWHGFGDNRLNFKAGIMLA